jgi:hypothetical protein
MKTNARFSLMPRQLVVVRWMKGYATAELVICDDHAS